MCVFMSVHACGQLHIILIPNLVDMRRDVCFTAHNDWITVNVCVCLSENELVT